MINCNWCDNAASSKFMTLAGYHEYLCSQCQMINKREMTT
jgi:hypothetical protein